MSSMAERCAGLRASLWSVGKRSSSVSDCSMSSTEDNEAWSERALSPGMLRRRPCMASTSPAAVDGCCVAVLLTVWRVRWGRPGLRWDWLAFPVDVRLSRVRSCALEPVMGKFSACRCSFRTLLDRFDRSSLLVVTRAEFDGRRVWVTTEKINDRFTRSNSYVA